VTDNPILREEVLGRFSISAPRPVPRGDTRLVFVDSRGQLHAPQEPITLGEAVWGNLRRLYEVDVAEHAASAQTRLPCREKGFYFDVSLQFRWRVHLPERIVQDRRDDAPALCREHLVARLMEHSEQFGLEERQAAQEQLATKLADPMALDEGITILRCTVALGLDDEAERHLAERTRARFAGQTRELTHEARIQDIQLSTVESQEEHVLEAQVGHQRGEHKLRQAQLEAQLDALRHERERAEEVHRIEIARANEAHQRELARQEVEFELERMRLYGKALASGETTYVLMFLDKHPGDADKLLQLLLSERDANFENSRKLVTTLIEHGLVDGADLDETTRRALRNLFEGLDTRAVDALLNGRRAPMLDATATEGSGGTPGAGATALPDAESDHDNDDDEDDDEEEG
jgi:hypothetical protein